MARPARPSEAADQSELSRLVELVRSTVPPVHPAGLPFIAGGLGLAAAGRRHRWIRTAGLSAASACALFFRHPPRVPPTRPGVVVAPADGRVTLIDRAVPPAELGLATRADDAHQHLPVGVRRARAARAGRRRGRQRQVPARSVPAPPTRTRPATTTSATACGSARRTASTSSPCRSPADRPAHRLRRQRRRQARPRRDLRPDPVRLPAGHLLPRRTPTCSSSSASARSAARPSWPSCRDETRIKPAAAQRPDPAQRDHRAGDLRGSVRGQVRARRQAAPRPWRCSRVAAILDALDGGIARLLNATSQDGRGDRLAGRRGELRRGPRASSSTRRCCRAVPGRLDRRAGLRGLHRAAAGAVQRAARRRDQPAYEKEFFVGMPAPAGAIGAIGPIAAMLQFGRRLVDDAPWVVCRLDDRRSPPLLVSRDPDAGR